MKSQREHLLTGWLEIERELDRSMPPVLPILARTRCECGEDHAPFPLVQPVLGEDLGSEVTP